MGEETQEATTIGLQLKQLEVKEEHIKLQFKWAFRIGMGLVVFSLLVAMYLFIDSLDSQGNVERQHLYEYSGNTLILTLLIILSLVGAKFAKSNALFRYQQERIRLDYDMNFANKYPSIHKAGKDDYYASLVKLNIDNLQRNYELVRVHSNRSFMTSVSIATAGFIFIAIGLVAGVSNSEHLPITYISTGAGVITTFISSMFFVMYSKTVTQMKGYHDSLLNVQDVLLAFKVVHDAPNPETRESMMTALLTTLISVKTHKDL